MSLHLAELSYVTEQFVNKVIEYSPGHFLCSVWDSNKFIVIDHEQERISEVITHPTGTQTRCWGLQKIPGFDLDSVPFVIARDNTGLVIIDVIKNKAY